MDIRNQRVLVIGMARSGIGAALLAAEEGAFVTLCESKPAEKVDPAIREEVKTLPVTCLFGTVPDEALLKETDLIILSPGVPTDLPFLKLAADMKIPVIGEIELSSWFCRAPVIGITGTNGKTTTTAMTGAIMQAAYPGTEIVGNIGTAFSTRARIPSEKDYVVAELSSFQLETIDTFHPHISAVLNITPDHLNRHHTMQAYMEAKQRIYENQDENDFCILNADDAECLRMAEELSSRAHPPRVILFSRRSQPDGGIWTENGSIVSAISGEKRSVVSISELQIFGAHNEENALAAIACAIAAGVGIYVIREAAKAFQGVPHRIEYIADIAGVPYYNDSKATNPDAAVKGLLAMKQQVILIGGGMDKQIPFDEWTALMPGRVKKLILIGETREIIRESALKAGLQDGDVILTDTLESAVHIADQASKPGDCVLLSPACASWDMFDNFEQRGDLFRKYVLRLQS